MQLNLVHKKGKDTFVHFLLFFCVYFNSIFQKRIPTSITFFDLVVYRFCCFYRWESVRKCIILARGKQDVFVR